MEIGDRRKSLYPTSWKISITVLLFLSALLCMIFGSFFLRLTILAIDDSTARMEGGQYYTTVNCADKMHIAFNQLSDYLRKCFDVNGQYDRTQFVDITKNYNNGIAGKYTFYTLQDMYQMYVLGCSNNLCVNADKLIYEEYEALDSENLAMPGHGLSVNMRDWEIASVAKSEELMPKANLTNIVLEYIFKAP
ncbi:MAG: hypothetical protein HUJ74_00530 [Lachnospiraceae bacterium]|nr:hypothetical protein [Lachnospiraceae bacterium]